MNCKHDGKEMEEYPDKWECSCGYRIAKLDKRMSPSEINKIVQEMKEYYRCNK
jgi:hypothetical protein